MNYRAKREARGLYAYTVSKELGLSYLTYLKVEKGQIRLSQDKLDKFLEIIENSAELKIEQDIKFAKVKQEYENGTFRQYLLDNNIQVTAINKYVGLSHSFASALFSGQTKNPNAMLWVYDICHDSICVDEIKSTQGVRKAISFNRKGKDKQTKNNNAKVTQVETIETESKIDKEPISVVIDNREIENLKQENEQLKRQIMLYEKLIEKL